MKYNVCLDNCLAIHNNLVEDTRQSLERVDALLDSIISLEMSSCDDHCSNYRNKLIEMCKKNNLFNVNGRLRENRLTCKDRITVAYVLNNVFYYSQVKDLLFTFFVTYTSMFTVQSPLRRETIKIQIFNHLEV